MADERLEVVVSIQVREGDVWRDPDGNIWRVMDFQGDYVLLERTVATRRQVVDVAKRWRKVGRDERLPLD